VKLQDRTVTKEVQDVRFGFVDQKRREVGVVVVRRSVELVAVDDTGWWLNIDHLPAGPAFYFSVMSARNGETFGSAAATGYVATEAEREEKIKKAIASSRNRLAKKFS
jgi:hypothetical protein